MNLISCDNCGVVLDKDKLIFPDIWDDATGEKRHDMGVWYNGRMWSKLPCPVCEADILGDAT